MRVLQFSPGLQVFYGNYRDRRAGVQRAANHGLGLVALGDDDRGQAMISSGDPAVTTDKINIARSLHQKLGHDRIIVASLGEMTIRACLGFGVARKVRTRIGWPAVPGVLWVRWKVLERRAASDGMRHVGTEGDSRHAVARDGLLLHVNRLAVRVVRADVDHRTRRAAGPNDAICRRVAVLGQHEDDRRAASERTIRNIIAGDVSLIVKLRHLAVGTLGR